MLGALLALGYTALFLLAIRRWRFFRAPGLTPRTIGLAFLVKIAAGTVLWYIYTYHYTDRANADIYKYFDDGNILFSALRDKPLDYVRMLFGIQSGSPYFHEHYYAVMNNWDRLIESNLFNDSRTIIRFNAFVRLFSFGHYHVHTVFACFVGLIGLVALYKAFVPFIAGHERLFTLLLFFLPSALFWGSGVIKETLLFFGLGLFVMLAFKAIDRRLTLRGVVLLFLSLFVLFVLKFYVLMSLAPALIAYAWWRWNGDKRVLLINAVVLGVFIVAAVNIQHIVPSLNIMEVIRMKQSDFIGMAVYTKANSLVDVTRLEDNVWSFVRTAPEALYMTYLSPFIMWNKGALGLLSAGENLLLVLLVMLAIIYRRPWARVNKGLLAFCLVYIVLLGLVIGWTTPVVGALVRYRVPLLPFFVMACLLVTDPTRIPWPNELRSFFNAS
jgi:hypothetical protein